MIRLFLFLFSLCLAGCGISTAKIDPDRISSINIIDHNGMSETISTKDRLEAFENTDFLSPQPYQKVMRVYGREKNGDVHSCITSYHPNGQIKQYLEAVNNRAFGNYREWFSNGKLKVEALVIGGLADVNNKAEESWLFDGITRAFDEEGSLLAAIPYSKGEMQGKAQHFHPNGNVWKISHYEKNMLQGKQEIYLEDGTLFQTSEYALGNKNGVSERFWETGKLAYQETYSDGLLLDALYLGGDGNILSEIHHGSGFRSLFGKKELLELQEWHDGHQEGKVKVFDKDGELFRVYSIKGGEKHGEEIDYFLKTTQPKLLLTWNLGCLQGPIKTWYDNGQLESQKEITENKKNGLLTVWYKDGSLMLIEEYENDKLVKGEYFRLGEKIPMSKVEKGKGFATLFNEEGNIIKKVCYHDGLPIE